VELERNPYEPLWSLLMLLLGMCGVIVGVAALGAGLAEWIGSGRLVGHAGGPLMLFYIAVLGIGGGTVFVRLAAGRLRRLRGD
jgi:hypothetical protein